MADVFLINDTMEHHEYVPKKIFNVWKLIFFCLIINEKILTLK